MQVKVNFKDGTVCEVKTESHLSETLDVTNSPILFGCRTGICGTCIVKVHNGNENLNLKTEEESEVLELYTSEENTRLACMLKPTGDIKLEYLGK